MKKLKEYITNFINGFMMALADSVPGVSGGTIAFLMGFYDKFITSLNNLLSKNDRKDGIKYLIKIGIGWVVGMILSILILGKFFETNIYQVSSLFLGFIIFSIPLIIKEELKTLKGKYSNIVFTILGILLVLLITYFNNTELVSVSLTNITIPSIIYIFIAGMIAISAMILPGISGSTLLLIFGLYVPVITGLKDILHFNFSPLLGIIIFGLGIITGALTIIKLLKSALDKYRTQTIYTIIGLMLGSIYSIIMGPTTLDKPMNPITFETFSIVFFVVGGIVVLGLQLLKRLNEK